MTEPHWNEADPADDGDYPRIEAAAPGQQDEFPSDWSSEPTPRDQEALDSGAAEEALYQDLVDAGWTPPASGQHALVGDGDPAVAQIDEGPETVAFSLDPMADDGAGADVLVEDGADLDLVSLPHWD